MEGFNNFEQGILIACAVFSTGAIMWLAITIPSACLRTIDMAHHQRRTADALVNINRTLRVIADQGERVEITETKQPAFPVAGDVDTITAAKVAAAQAIATGGQRD